MAQRHVTSRDPMSIQQKGKQALSMCRAIGRSSRTLTGRVSRQCQLGHGGRQQTM